MKMRLLIHSLNQVVQVSNQKSLALAGKRMNEMVVLDRKEHGPLAIVVNEAGLIEAVGSNEELKTKYDLNNFSEIVDGSDKVVVPGLIDGHTHPVWAGDRVHEFGMKLEGASYMEIHEAGGGIHFTVEQTRAASEEELYESAEERLLRMLRSGTTLVECKSGYGLDGENEIKMLRVLERAKREIPIEISTTFCGAHAVPKGKTAKEATDDVVNNQLVMLKEALRKGEVDVDNVDVFCEKGVFEVEDARRILQAGRRLGLRLNFHAEELAYIGSAEMGASLGAEAMSHLERVSLEGMKAMARVGTIPVLLPMTALLLKLPSPPIADMVETGLAIALGTDFNPNAFCTSMPMTMYMACVQFGMSMQQAMVASTLNAAASLGRSATHGSLEPGKVGDILLIDSPRWEHLIYQFGSHHETIELVIKRGIIVHRRQ